MFHVYLSIFNFVKQFLTCIVLCMFCKEDPDFHFIQTKKLLAPDPKYPHLGKPHLFEKAIFRRKRNSLTSPTIHLFFIIQSTYKVET